MPLSFRPVAIALFVTTVSALVMTALITPAMATPDMTAPVAGQQTAPKSRAQELREAWTVLLYFENDLFYGEDRYYTNAVQLRVISPDLATFANSDVLPENPSPEPTTLSNTTFPLALGNTFIPLKIPISRLCKKTTDPIQDTYTEPWGSTPKRIIA